MGDIADYGVPHAKLDAWIQHELPELLAWVRQTFPRCRIAFRTAPTIETAVNGMSPQALEAMHERVQEHLQEDKLFGEYDVIDYYAIMDKFLKRNSLETAFADVRHPGQAVSLQYVDEL